ncbi:SpoIIE family protein phosphatase [Streptomyces sp. PA03-6a]|nr:SpoIIE family protein phosphatase [Streptomyces sp. PA03-6a]
MVDDAGVVRGWGEGATQLLGHPASEALGKPFADLFPLIGHPEDQQAADVVARLHSARGWEGRQAVHRADGRRLDLEVKILPAQDSGSCPLRIILATDPTQNWWAAAAGSLAEGITLTAPVGMAILDTELRFTWVNDAMEHLCGIPRSRFLGRRPGDLLPGLNVADTEAEIRNVLETGHPSTGREHIGHVLPKPYQATYSTSCFRLENEYGQTLGACYTVLPTTDHYRAQQKLGLLNESRKRMGNTLNVTDAAQELADASVPEFADHVTVDLFSCVLHGEQPRPGPVSAASATNLRCAGYRSIRNDVLPEGLPGSQRGFFPLSPTARALDNGISVLIAELHPADPLWITDNTSRSAHARALGIHSLMIVPIRSRDTTLGAATFARSRNPAPFQPDDLDIAEELAAHAAVCIDNARRYTHEHAAALTLQRSLLPKDLPTQNAVEAAYRYLPADAEAGVGGDWFDVLPLSGARVALVVGDVVGHGIHAAATMGRLRAAVQTLADIDLAPDEVLAHLDDMVSRIAQEAPATTDVTGATCLYATYDPVTRDCTLSRAGHPAPVLVTPDGDAQLIDLPSGPPLGLGGLPFQATKLHLTEGSILALYTNGLIQAPTLDPDRGLEQLLEKLSTQRISLQGLCDASMASLADGQPSDDAALLVARTRTLDADHIASWDIPKDPSEVASARALATRQLVAWGLDDLTFTTELVVSELVTNAIRYASDPIRLRLIRDRTLICEVSDGSSTSPHIRHARTTDEGGRGLFLIAQVAERWGARYGFDGKTVWSEQPLTEQH